MSQAEKHWRSLADLEQRPRYLAALQREFGPGATEIEIPTVSRRSFMGLLGASTALAGVTTLAGCIRKPQEPILPFASRPEDMIPGKPRFYATAALIAGSVEGLLVESQDGRPTKIEGNPRHPMSRGASSAWAQAEILGLYDPERSRQPVHKGKAATWKQFFEFAAAHLGPLERARGMGLALLVEHRPSPTYHHLLDGFRRRFPQARIFVHDEAYPASERRGLAMAGYPGHAPQYALEGAEVILSLDADFLATEGDIVSNSRGFAARRQVSSPDHRMSSPDHRMNRLYSVEPFPTVTGAMADHRLALKGSRVASFLAALVGELERRGLQLPQGARAPEAIDPKRFGKWIPALAQDLLSHRGRSVIICGRRQPSRVHALAQLVNMALGAVDSCLGYRPVLQLPTSGTLEQLCQEMHKGVINTLIMLGTNPVYDTPADLKLSQLIKRVPVTIHHSLHLDETSRRVTWHLPRSHFLEAWGDLQATDGTVSIQQPLIAPLFGTLSELELLGRLAGERGSEYELVRSFWSSKLEEKTDYDDYWKRWLHDGVPPDDPRPHKTPDPGQINLEWEKSGSADGLELAFQLDPSLFDGRYANNGWLQELPDPVTKLTWDNAACLSPGTAVKLGLEPMDMVELSLAERRLRAAIFVVPGIAEDTLALALGYGREHGGSVAQKAGFNANLLRSLRTPYFEAGLKVAKLNRRYILATTQDHGSMAGRPIIREATVEQYRADPRFAKKQVEHPPLKSIWTEPNERGGHQWGMSIDLNLCTGCNACVVACQAENNIPVVGKRRVLEGREMHWIRLDRYFAGSPEDPRILVQPMGCHHCELAPCEGVCPVAATVHSPEGLNDMAYNRCIGTRYCSNNCPYKVRRFNFFQYNKGLDPVARMQKNPDVTVRFRGVMEKCTYCVQRITEARIGAKRHGNGVIPDGTITPACAQACPTSAIVFGNINDPQSAVSRRKADPRDYAVLSELNVKPRTTYLAKLRNPNPELS